MFAALQQEIFTAGWSIATRRQVVPLLPMNAERRGFPIHSMFVIGVWAMSRGDAVATSLRRNMPLSFAALLHGYPALEKIFHSSPQALVTISGPGHVAFWKKLFIEV